MADEFETLFKDALFKKYNSCQKNLIPKDIYNSTIEQLKLASEKKADKSRQEYYILQK